MTIRNIMNFEECKAKYDQGIPCQMRIPGGNWVKFDPTRVITEFAEAPRLGPNDGPRVLLYVLHSIEQILKSRFSDQDISIKLPKHGPKKDWRITEEETVPLGRSSNDRYRDIFKSYFRVVKSSFKENSKRAGLVVDIVPDTTMYTVERRELEKHDEWVPVFTLRYVPFKMDSRYTPAKLSDNTGFNDWLIHCDSRSFVGCGTWSNTYDHLKKAKGASIWADDAVSFQRIQTIDPLHKSGGDAIFNIAAFVAHYLMIISELDTRAEEMANVIENHVQSNDGISYQILRNRCEDDRTVVLYRLTDKFRQYCNAAFGKNEHTCWSHTVSQRKAILLRYFNDKFGNIDSIELQNDDYW